MQNKNKLTRESFDEVAACDAGGVSYGPRVVAETLNERRLQRRHMRPDGVMRKFGAEFRDTSAGGFADGVIVSSSLCHVKIDERR